MLEVAGKIGLVAPAHIGAIGSKVGTILGVMVTVKLVVVAQSPESGVKL